MQPSLFLLLFIMLFIGSFRHFYRRFPVVRFQYQRAVLAGLISANLAYGAQHEVFRGHVGAHHSCARNVAERYRSLLCVDVEVAEDAVASGTSGHALPACVEADVGFLAVFLCRYALAVHFGYLPFAADVSSRRCLVLRCLA